MKITATKIKKELIKEHGWYINYLDLPLTKSLVADVLIVVDKI